MKNSSVLILAVVCLACAHLAYGVPLSEKSESLLSVGPSKKEHEQHKIVAKKMIVGLFDNFSRKAYLWTFFFRRSFG